MDTKCPICGQEFSETTLPKKLGCGHSFCLKCCEGKVKGGSRYLTCFSCGLDCDVSGAQGVAGLPTNTSLLPMRPDGAADPTIDINNALRQVLSPTHTVDAYRMALTIHQHLQLHIQRPAVSSEEYLTWLLMLLSTFLNTHLPLFTGCATIC
eukprot:TRINITY_DN1891_c1_g1_i2.p2 TRINITY_DN1891_c1_g1~~TRINITY_DN1891_c1_g1_i2.p2  ORF type:complete len:152 (+),score=19.31 TRINITY_DN1891_c1_g1_i2:61-516(+)